MVGQRFLVTYFLPIAAQDGHGLAFSTFSNVKKIWTHFFPVLPFLNKIDCWQASSFYKIICSMQSFRGSLHRGYPLSANFIKVWPNTFSSEEVRAGSLSWLPVCSSPRRMDATRIFSVVSFRLKTREACRMDSLLNWTWWKALALTALRGIS